MNLHQIVAGAIGSVNPFVNAQVMVSTGYTTAADGSRTPTYSVATNVPVQIQALSAREIEHLDGLNIQNVTRSAYLNGDIEGLDRKFGLGGDLIVYEGITWLVVQVMENWSDTAGWTRVALTQQVT